jgi:Mg-chelatase subunit ChlD
VIVLVAIVLVLVIVFLALAVDVGYLYVVKQDLQTAADAGALAGASGLSVSQDEARARAIAYAQKNPSLTTAVTIQPSDVELIPWPPDSPPETPPTAVRVTAQFRADRGNAVGLYLAKVLGVASSDVAASAIASLGARDIVLVLDYSASMSYDSQVRHIGRLGSDAVEQSLENMWGQLKPWLPAPQNPKLINLVKSIKIDSTNTTTILETLGLKGVSYPYPPCTWSDYFDYVQGKATPSNDSKTIATVDVEDEDTGLEDTLKGLYGKRYGYLTLMNYLQAVQYKASEAPNLWRTAEEPATAVKEAVSLFLYYMEHPRTDDRVGLTAFTSTQGSAKLEVSLTANYTSIDETAQQRQAGHYHNQTNIAAGIRVARDEIRTHGRTGAQRLIVLLSDGAANLKDNDNDPDPAGAKTAALQQARLAAKDKLRILTISLGAAADTGLMQQIADLTGGTHFVIPGGHAVSEYRAQLLAVFTKIALQRPVKLVY